MPEPHRVLTALPTGAVTFLFTDIEGSTALWEQDGAQMSQALAEHDALARRVIHSHHGAVVKMTGDGVHAAFEDALDAVAASVDLQQALVDSAATRGLPLRVRCGLHTGVVERRDNDYFGSPVNRAARIMGAAHGGQVLLSQAVVDAVRERLPAAVSLRDLGKVRLKDLSTPEHVYQVAHPQLRQEFPALRSLEASPNNLPQQATSFIGRQQELGELQQLLARSRLLTLTGSGGCGKTRLCLQVAADSLEQYPDGVWLVELGPLVDPCLVPQTVATLLGLKEASDKPIAATLTEYLKDKRLVLLLDNCEHLRDACAQLADMLLRECPQVKILASSREALGIRGEQAYRVPSLSLPDPTLDHMPASVASFEAVQLFTDRALLARADFRVTQKNAAAVASVCHRLDGIPLAIELAAARLRSLSVEEIHRKLDQRFLLLTGSSRTVPHRQQTLRAAIDWSYDLLSDVEKALFCALSVFAGGWTLEAAEEVCAGEGIESQEVLDLLTSLVDKSLVVAEERAAVTRYRFLETVHQYATEHLQGLGKDAHWCRRHLAHFLALAEAAEPQLTGKDQQAWLDRLETEHDNLRLALARSTGAAGDRESGLRLTTALSRFWLVRGYLAEGRAWVSRLLAGMAGGEKATRAKALNWSGVFAWKQGDYRAAQVSYEQSLAIRRELGDRRGVGAVLNNQGLLAYEQGDYAAARALHEASLAIDRELGDRWGIAVSLVHLGSLATVQGDYPAARALYEESLAIFRECGDRGHIANALRSLGGLCSEQDDHPAARALFDESLAICRELGDRSGIGRALYGLGVTARHQGDYAAARVLYGESLAICRELGDREGTANALHNLGQVAAACADYPSARALEEESLAIYRDLGNRSGIAASIEGLADIACDLGESLRAACLWGGMERLREEIGASLVPSERRHHDRKVAAAHTALGGVGGFELAWQKGRSMLLDQAIACALNTNDA